MKNRDVREPDAGPIPSAMLDDLRSFLKRLERTKVYAIVIPLATVGLWITAGALCLSPSNRHEFGRSILALGAVGVLILIVYGPFFQRWRWQWFVARGLREVLFPQRLEDLAQEMGALRLIRATGNDATLDDLVRIWQKHGLEPGQRARRLERPRFV